MNGTMQPLVTIITPVVDRVATIDEAVRSALEQHGVSIEHVVIDGGSKDGTLDALARHPHLRVYSARDDGMYDALNRGLAHARGEIVGFLNSDDLYAPGCVAAAVDMLADPGVDAVAGAATFFRAAADGTRREIYRSSPIEGSALERATLGSPAFNAWFFRRELFARLGPFDPAYRIAGDREFMLRVALHGARYRETERVFYHYRHHPGSMTIGGSGHSDRIVDEHLRMTESLLARGDLPAAARVLLGAVRTRDTLDGAARALLARRWSDALRYVRAGNRHDPAWHRKMLGRAWSALMRRINIAPRA